MSHFRDDGQGMLLGYTAIQSSADLQRLPETSCPDLPDSTTTQA
jgi:hypothetical protein